MSNTSPSPRRRVARAVLLAAATASVATSALARTTLAQTAPVPAAALAARVDSMAAAFLNEAPATGLTLAVVRGRDTIVHKGYGLADVAANRPATANTIYRTGSVTKQFTAAAILQLVEQGKLALTDTLGRFLPQYPQWAHVTIRQLLNHTSGIRSYTGSREWAQRNAQPLTPDALLAFVAADTFDFAPGTGYRYNNSGYVLLGMILEKLTGTPYDRYMTERFFRPLGMRTASYCPSTTSDAAFASGYDRRGVGKPAPTAPLHMSSPYSAGALCMTTGDFLKWQTALTSGRIVKPETFARMASADTLRSGAATRYGWALAPADIGGHRVIEHGGDVNGFSVQQLWLPDDSLRIVVFTNTLGSVPDRLARNVARAALGVPLVQPPRLPATVALSAAERARYVGSYDIQLPGRTLGMRIFEQDGRLMSQPDGQGIVALLPFGNHEFAAEIDPNIRLTFSVDGERATKFVLQQGGGRFEAPRVK